MDQLEALLNQFLLPDNEARKQAEEYVKKLSKDPSIIPALLHHMRVSSQPFIRQLSAVLMRKKIAVHWKSLTPEIKENLKTNLLDSIANESSPLVRKACADVVSIIAQLIVPNGEWNNLLPFLLQCSQSPQEDHREVALILFSSLTETIPEILHPHFSTLHSVFIHGLKDQQSNRVRIAALKAVASLIDYVETEEEITLFRQLIPPILDVTKFFLSNGDDEDAIKTFEILDEIIEFNAYLLNNEDVILIVHFVLEIVANTSINNNTRYQAAQTIAWLTQYKPKTLTKTNLLEPIFSILTPMLALSRNVNSLEMETENEDILPSTFSAQIINAMAIHLPKKQIFNHFFSFSQENYNSKENSRREASIMCIAIISEGCSEIMKRHVSKVLHMILECLKDEDEKVRGNCCFALGELSQHLGNKISEKYELIFPSLFSVLNDKSSDVKEKAYFALASLCEHLEEEILPYLHPLMNILVESLNSNNKDLQEISMSALSSSVAAAQNAFLPYSESIILSLLPFLHINTVDSISLRSKAMELFGIIAIAVGKENILKFINVFMDSAINGFSLDLSDLREYSFSFFGSMAQVLEFDFVQYLPYIIPLIYSTLKLDDGVIMDMKKFEKENNDDDDDDIDEDIDEDNDEDNDKKLNDLSIRTGILDEKAAAVQALGLFALHTKHHFKPYILETFEFLKNVSTYFHEDVRLQSIISLQYLFIATREAYPDISNNENIIQFSPESKHLFDNIMEIYLKSIQEDDDNEVVSQICLSLCEIIKISGKNNIDNYLEKLLVEIGCAFDEDLLCQQNYNEDEIEIENKNENENENSISNLEKEAKNEKKYVDEEDEEFKFEFVIDSFVEMVIALSSVYKNDFFPYFDKFFPSLLKFTKPTRSSNDKNMVLAFVAEISKQMKVSMSPYLQKMIPFAMNELSSDESQNRRNSSFCIGKLCEYGGNEALQYYPNLLMTLFPLFQENESDNGVKDNAVACVTRMIAASPTNVPLDQVLPVLLTCLPLKEDMDESENVYSCLCNLIFSSHPHVSPHLHQIISVLSTATMDERNSMDVRVMIGSNMKKMMNFHPQFQQILSSLPDSNSIFAFISSCP